MRALVRRARWVRAQALPRARDRAGAPPLRRGAFAGQDTRLPRAAPGRLASRIDDSRMGAPVFKDSLALDAQAAPAGARQGSLGRGLRESARAPLPGVTCGGLVDRLLPRCLAGAPPRHQNVRALSQAPETPAGRADTRTFPPRAPQIREAAQARDLRERQAGGNPSGIQPTPLSHRTIDPRSAHSLQALRPVLQQQPRRAPEPRGEAALQGDARVQELPIGSVVLAFASGDHELRPPRQTGDASAPRRGLAGPRAESLGRPIALARAR